MKNTKNNFGVDKNLPELKVPNVANHINSKKNTERPKLSDKNLGMKSKSGINKDKDADILLNQKQSEITEKIRKAAENLEKINEDNKKNPESKTGASNSPNKPKESNSGQGYRYVKKDLPNNEKYNPYEGVPESMQKNYFKRRQTN